jgi:hypothetical protein
MNRADAVDELHYEVPRPRREFIARDNLGHSQPSRFLPCADFFVIRKGEDREISETSISSDSLHGFQAIEAGVIHIENECRRQKGRGLVRHVLLGTSPFEAIALWRQGVTKLRVEENIVYGCQNGGHVENLDRPSLRTG